MKSDLHNELQNKAANYLMNQGYWIKAVETPTPVGIIDVWGMNRNLGFITKAIEVKVSRQDWKSQSQKWKERQNEHIANTCFILCPAELIKPDEVYETWGLLWWNGERIVNKKQGKFVEMSDRQKLEILIYWLSNGANQPKPMTL